MNIKANANANGWVGRNSLSVSVRDNGNSTDVDGWLGSDSVHIHQNGQSITGSISGATGFSDVNLSVSHTAHGSQLHGWVGHQSVSLSDDNSGNGRHNIHGYYGNSNLSFSRNDRSTSSSIDGDIQSPDLGYQRVSVNVNGGIPNQMEALYPLLGYLGAAMKAAL